MSLKTAETDIRELAENFCAVGKGKIPKTGLTKRMRAWMSARVGKKEGKRHISFFLNGFNMRPTGTRPHTP